ncbi:DEAD/DEAH box helicase family protein [Virgibacillus sp. C22-A2]|uniref:DEAD/DEAH box helicase family protein n=1 Tax=Virgibacillus tibetensis TaxID=3042313 RepID=A0ABU6KCQ8_9BACI|nr:DEAD/DEAH box helicase family protein [Virgibacillus sp. C22-A2]
MKNHNYQLQKALEECEQLKKENNQLKKLLKLHNIPIELNQNQSQNSQLYSKEKKIKDRIKLFRNLFKGREDVFAVRWEYDNGKKGYSPARDRQRQNLLPITDQVIYDHLIGKRIIGVYPMLKDETCWFLAVDFDKNNWKMDASAFIEVCKSHKVPVSIEISRSGNGCHIWIFFENSIPANLARRLGNVLLTRTLEKRYQLGIDSYDRMFPNQDTLPQGGFGNLIALPLQHFPRKSGNSVFVDENFNAYPDQWSYLAKIRKMDRKEIESIVKKNHQIEQSTFVVNESTSSKDKLPIKLTIILKNGIYIPKDGLPSKFINEMVRLATFNNPEYFKAQANRLSTYKIPRMIDCTDNQQDYLILPRGCLEDLRKLLKAKNIELIIKDEMNSGKPFAAEFHGQLTGQQEDAVQNMLNYQNGILSATTGFGKTVVAASLISNRKVNTLVIVHRKQLMDQWKERLSTFLNIDTSKIGQIGGGKNSANGAMDIATIQTLNYKGKVKDYILEYGQIIVDECHHISAFSFESVLKKAEARYVHGLTATPTRKDGLQPIMAMQCGPIRYKVTAKNQARVRPFNHVLIPRNTPFKSKLNREEKNIQTLYRELVKSNSRNEMIFNDVLKELENGASPIILTERIEHVREFELMFKGFAKNIIVLTGGMNKKDIQNKLEQLESISDEKERLVIATGKYIGEGFDNAVMDTMFLAMPISWKGTLQQYVGRLHRLHDDKNVVKVYDYVDHREEVFRNMYEKRKKGYKALGYIMEGSDSPENESTQQMKLF